MRGGHEDESTSRSPPAPTRTPSCVLGEWSSDSPAMIAHIVQSCLPYVRGMSYWQGQQVRGSADPQLRLQGRRQRLGVCSRPATWRGPPSTPSS
ncbi:hypothetical protein ACRAWD_27635 [Caulobacter segnis]